MSNDSNDHVEPTPEPESSSVPAMSPELPGSQAELPVAPTSPEPAAEPQPMTSEAQPASAPSQSAPDHPAGSPVPAAAEFGAIPRHDRVRWINPRRRFAAGLVALSIAFGGFGAGIGTALAVAGASHHSSDHERVDREGPRDGAAIPGHRTAPRESQLRQGPGKQQQGTPPQRRAGAGAPGRAGAGSTGTASPGTTDSEPPAPGAASPETTSPAAPTSTP